MSTLQRRDTDHPRTSSQRSNGRRGGLFRSAAVLVVITALMVQSGGSVSGQIAAKGATVVKIDFGSGGKKLGETARPAPCGGANSRSRELYFPNSTRPDAMNGRFT